MKQTQKLLLQSTLMETKWQAVKSKGVVLVFREIYFDRRQPKDWQRYWVAGYFIPCGVVGNCMRGCDITTSDIWQGVCRIGGKRGGSCLVAFR